ncbi:MAG: biotin-independent malonate decarboxylase subunit gamma [Moraxella sp.]|nr:biotin-independent malonate decarboxylase subunit gamma [Moraxella sp.]
MTTTVSTKGLDWFILLTKNASPIQTPVPTIRAADIDLAGQQVSLVVVTPDSHNLYPRARQGEMGLLEGYGLASVIQNIIALDIHATHKRPIIALVDVPSQVYGRREELFGIHQALAAAVDAYAQARLAGHPVVSLLVGKAMSGAFLAHGYQAHHIIALDDEGVMVHAMGKESAARITLRSIDELEKLAADIPPMAYDIRSYQSLGLVNELLSISDINQPSEQDVQVVKDSLVRAIDKIQNGQITEPLCVNRLSAANRAASKRVRELLHSQWHD